MFSLFKKKEPGIRVIDKIVIAEPARWKAMLETWNKNPDLVFIFWFDESLEQASSYFTEQGASPITLLSSREAATVHIKGKPVFFAEHYPLRSKEEELYRKLNLDTVTVFSALQEPLFKLFGSEKIIQLMQQLGMKEDEVIEHKMISRSVADAQQKIEKKLVIEQTARSQEEWFKKNSMS